MKYFITAIVGLLMVGPVMADSYMTTIGAGTKDGSSWENALSYDASDTALSDAWAKLTDGETLFLGAGDYAVKSHTLTGTGSAENKRKLVGVNQNDAVVRFTGKWKKEDKGKGASLFYLKAGLSGFSIENITITDCIVPFRTYTSGQISHGEFKNLTIKRVRDAFMIYGGGTKENPKGRSHHLLFTDITIEHYTKRGLRFRDGVHHVTAKNVVADMGGKDWYIEPFPMGFSVQGGKKGLGVYDHDITFINCVAKNNYQSKAQKDYWNADGFCAERNAYNITYIGCEAYDNTDGGWDDKSMNPLLVGCVSVGNKKNYRFWSNAPAVVLYRCLSAHSFKRGGNSNDTTFWTAGHATIVKSTLIGSKSTVSLNDWKKTLEDMKAQKVTIQDSIVSAPSGESLHFSMLKLVNTTQLPLGPVEGEAPGFGYGSYSQSPQPVKENYDSLTVGPAIGYHSTWAKEDALAAARKLQPLLEGPPAK